MSRMTSPFAALLLIHRLVGKTGQANLLRGVVKKVNEQLSTTAGSKDSISSGLSGRQSILYVCLWKNSLTADIGSLSRFSTSLYAQASSICPSIDVRLLLKSSIPTKNIQYSTTSIPSPNSSSDKQEIPSKSIDIVFVDSGIPKTDVSNFLIENLEGANPEQIPQHVIFDEDENSIDDELSSTGSETDKLFDIVALGGTFDRIHNGHKLLLTEAVLRCRNELIVGVTDEEMIRTKSLHELILPLDSRIKAVTSFLREISPPTLKLRVVPISDPYGPAITEENLKLLVVSQETFKAWDKINEIRRGKNLPEILVHSIQIYPQTDKRSSHEEDKISSSTQRLRNLGERLRPPNKEVSIPYIIGLTGGIASGKSTIGKYLVTLGAEVIDCDKLAHFAYTKGTQCFDKVVASLGREVVDKNTGDIDRKVVAGKVFGKPDELKKLTDIVWPEIQRLIVERIEEVGKKGTKIAVVDAAVLVEAQWDSYCHEVWVSFIPRDEAVRRIQERDHSSKEAAERRIDSQLSNKVRLEKATFAFSSLWEVEFTREQVLKAWNQIQNLIKNA